MTEKNLKHGDKVSWQSQGKTIEGEVEKKITQPMEIKGHHVAASPENPEYLVKSEKTGNEAAHHASSIKKKN